jgi:HPr kinase/phosphorylase
MRPGRARGDRPERPSRAALESRLQSNMAALPDLDIGGKSSTDPLEWMFDPINQRVQCQTIDINPDPAHLHRPMIRVHGTSVALGGEGVLLRGPSGSGKSDLALRLIDEGARLIADDQTELQRIGGTLRMSAPDTIAGAIEVRGLGILRVPSVAAAPLRLVVDLVAEEAAIERLPEPRCCELEGLSFPLLALQPFAASASAKLRLALKALAAP